MDEQTLLTIYSDETPEPRTDDCFEHIMRREIGDAFKGRANGDDASEEELKWIDEDIDTDA